MSSSTSDCSELQRCPAHMQSEAQPDV